MMRNFRYYLPGIALILAAILIIAVPEILIVLIAGLFLIAGTASLVLGHIIAKSDIDMGMWDQWLSNGNTSGRIFTCSPMFKWPRC